MNPIQSSPDGSSVIRGWLRLIALVVVLLATVPFCAITVPLVGIAGRIVRYRYVQILTPIVCGLFARAIGLRVRVLGTRSEEARIFVGNHVTYLDILVGAIGVAGVFVSRHDVREWPVIGIFARLAGTVFLDRRSLKSAVESSRGIVERAGEGIRILLFPEGGTTSGNGVGPFRPFLFSGIVEAGLAVQPFTIRYISVGGTELTTENRDLVYWYDPAPGLTEHGWRLMKLSGVEAYIEFHDPIPALATYDRQSLRNYVEQLRIAVDTSHRKSPNYGEVP